MRDPKLTTQKRWLIFCVNAWLSSSAFGGSTGLAQFSSALGRRSSPIVTQGCSCLPLRKRLETAGLPIVKWGSLPKPTYS